jgi:CRISPR/Cas system-associated exonuclease Cas4 (RecB family)
MLGETAFEKHLGGGEAETPHLSYSRLSRYLLCPEQYRLYYVENLRPKVAPASLTFGQIIHRALAAFFTENSNPVQTFSTAWIVFKDVPLRYAFRESWDTLHERGQKLLQKFVTDEFPRLTDIQASEKAFKLAISNLDTPFVGIIDLLAQVDGKLTVVDFKTASAAYQDHEVDMSDQLTAYQLAEPGIAQSAFCVLVKTKEPRIDWYFSHRSGDRLVEFLSKTALVGRQIAARQFYKRPGKWCAYCDFLPVCLGNEQTIQESLVKAA